MNGKAEGINLAPNELLKCVIHRHRFNSPVLFPQWKKKFDSVFNG